MKNTFRTLSALVFCLILAGTTALAKPDKVEGINVPSGRIPQEIKNNNYPHTYFPGTVIGYAWSF